MDMDRGVTTGDTRLVITRYHIAAGIGIAVVCFTAGTFFKFSPFGGTTPVFIGENDKILPTPAAMGRLGPVAEFPLFTVFLAEGGSKIFRVDKNTTLTSDAGTVRAQDLKEGGHVSVFGVVEDSGEIRASAVYLFPPLTAPRPMTIPE